MASPIKTKSNPPTANKKLSTGKWNWLSHTSWQFAVSALVGISFALLILGPKTFNPTDFSWASVDHMSYLINWELFRQDPHLHWPLTFTDHINYPRGASIAYADPAPIYPVLLKPFSAVLPEPFNYLAYEAAIAGTLQFFFGLLIFRFLLQRTDASILIASSFLMFSLPLIWRMGHHITLSNQWLILAAIYVSLRLQKSLPAELRKLGILASLLAALAVSISLYIAAMVITILCVAAIGVGFYRPEARKIAGIQLVGILLASLGSAYVLGLTRLSGAASGGYRELSANVFSLIDPARSGALLIRPFPPEADGLGEGVNYLGLGVLLLGVALCVTVWRDLLKRRDNTTRLTPLFTAAALLALISFSTLIRIGPSITVDLDPNQHFTRYLAAFRASGRLYWAMFYLVSICILACVFRYWPRRIGYLLASLALLVQFADTADLRAVTRADLGSPQSPLHSQIWSSLRRFHSNLLVEPPFQCGDSEPNPAGAGAYRVFGLVAVAQHMRTNSYLAARWGRDDLKFQCETQIARFQDRALSDDSAYVVSPTVAQAIMRGPSGPKVCHLVDGFILCSTRTDFGLPAYVPPSLSLDDSAAIHFGGNEDARRYLGLGWHNTEDWGIWSSGSGEIRFLLSKEQRATYKTARLGLAAWVGPHAMHYRVRNGKTMVQGSIGGSLPNHIERFEVDLPLAAEADGMQDWIIETLDPVRPAEKDPLKSWLDWRLLGIGISSLELGPRPASINVNLTAGVYNGKPKPLSLTSSPVPNKDEILFKSVYYDPSHSTLRTFLMFNTALESTHGCFLQYDAVSQRITLITDLGNQDIRQSMVAGSPTVVANTQCSLDGSSSYVSQSGDTLTLGVALKFNPGFGGVMSAWQLIGTRNQPDSWVSAGTWLVSGSTARPAGSKPHVVGIATKPGVRAQM